MKQYKTFLPFLRNNARNPTRQNARNHGRQRMRLHLRVPRRNAASGAHPNCVEAPGNAHL
eukprot:1367090-Amorphochlora_amoeboformis.AAC.1